jgi:hypothetical protein
MSKLRQAALLVHGLGQADQDWLFSQLDAGGELGKGARVSLTSALHELQTLGIPRDAQLIEAVLASDTSSHARLSRAPASLVLRALEGQSIEAVATLLALHPWPWRQAVIAHWSALFQARPELLGTRDGAVGDALKSALLDAVAARLDWMYNAALPDMPSSRSASHGQTWRIWPRAWFTRRRPT